ncbi:hypothetical protein ACFLU5_10965 [Bacteroidota bacterium]
MRRIVFFFIISTSFFLTNQLFSQSNDEPQVLLGSSLTSISGFGGFLMEFSQVNGKIGVSTGGGGAVLFNQVFYFGGYGLGQNSEYEYVNPEDSLVNADLGFGHGGFWIGVITRPKKLIHFDVSTKLGWGNIALNEREYTFRTILNDKVFVAIPQVEVELNIAHWFRINGGVGYRFVTGVNNSEFGVEDFNSPEFSLSFLFGWYKDY